jgi:hypothetical protein
MESLGSWPKGGYVKQGKRLDWKASQAVGRENNVNEKNVVITWLNCLLVRRMHQQQQRRRRRRV